MLQIELEDGRILSFDHSPTLSEIAKEAGAEGIVGGSLNGEIIDVHTPIKRGGKLRFLRKSDKESLEILRHSTAHVLAKAVTRVVGGNVKLGIGPPTEEGFFYDFDLPVSLSEKDLERIEEEMEKIVKAGEAFRREEISREKALELFKDDPYKLELLESIPPDEPITIYWLGEDFFDLCRGPHLEHAGMVGAFKLLSVTGAYWKGDPKRKMLQRVHGTAFWKKEDLDDFLKKLEEAKKRDHRILGKQLDIFEIYEDAGAGLVFWHPAGAVLRQELEKWLEEEHRKRGYLRVYTPHMMRIDLWKTSGHLGFYRENMFFVPVVEHGERTESSDDMPVAVEDLKSAHWYAVKPMNCPGHILIYKSRVRSYRDLPLRFFELGTVYRYEKSGSLHGLLRVRGFTQDDGHIFCRPDQLKEEIEGVLDYVMDVLSTFNLDYVINIGTRPEKSIGSDSAWEHATQALISALESRGLKFNVCEGDGAFYGPKIDMAVLDAIGRMWDGPTIQVDFNLPERFDLTYVDRDGTKKRPVMVHRAILGSIERFVGLLIEHYAGLFPLWLAPTQVTVIPVSDKHLDYARDVAKVLEDAGVRVSVDDESARVGYKIRKAESLKIPYMLVVGGKEKESGTVSVRSKKHGNLGTMNLKDFLERILEEIEKKI